MRLNEATREHERLRQVGRALAHDSAVRHVTGAAVYVDDIREPVGLLHCAPGLSNVAAGRVTNLDLSAVRKAPGVVTVLTAADVPGENDVGGNGLHDDPILATEEIRFFGQVLFLVVAQTRDQARRAATKVKVTVAPSMPLIDVDDALAANSMVLDDYVFTRHQPETVAPAAIASAPKRLNGSFRLGGQEHFYLEGQVALAIPGEDGEMLVHSSTQHPTEIQHIVAHMLGLAYSKVTVEVRRVGGGFGGKESQATQWAALAALAAVRTGRPCKVRLDRDDDMLATGKRHDFRVDYSVGVNGDGLIQGVDVTLAARCGHSVDLSLGVVDRAMFHADNAYFYPAVRILSRRMRTNTVSNTAFRGFGGPQGMLFAERMLDDIAYALGFDPLDVRKANFYNGAGRDRTPYNMRVEDNRLQELVGQLEKSSNYRERRRKVSEFNASSPTLKRGLALTPVKFGISFTLLALNQAGALVHVYRDGSIHLNHGGTEMGQGLFIKVAQVVAEEFGVDLDKVRITATSTDKVPNASQTAASAGTDLNAMAAVAACQTIKDRLYDLIQEKWDVGREKVAFRDGQVIIGNRSITLADLAGEAWKARVSLSAAGYYKTPKIEWDRPTATGRPFFYFAYGAACSEVLVDTMTGEMRVDRVDILHDVGHSLNPGIDIGQIEGAFVQGMGWLTTEELVWDSAGRLRTHAPSTYKIPCASDVPADFRVALFDGGGNREDTIYRSKAVGEPPLMLAISVFCAIVNALSSLKKGVIPPLNAPATPEAIMRAVRLMTGAGAAT